MDKLISKANADVKTPPAIVARVGNGGIGSCPGGPGGLKMRSFLAERLNLRRRGRGDRGGDSKVDRLRVGLDKEEKRKFWEVLDEVIRGMPSSEKILTGGDFNGQIGSLPIGYNDVHGGFSFGDRNDNRSTLLNFARAFGKCDRALCKDCKVILNENLTTQHRLLVMDLVFKMGKKRKGEKGRFRVRWGNLTPTRALVIGAKLWNKEVKKKVETKKVAYMKLAESKDEEKKRVSREEYKVAKKKVKFTVMAAKSAAFERLYLGLEEKGG
ncbi:uncharacterized protein LOC124887114 [Capsicum annuum]|uniref:uncharacterized protein LOC124887114 n=1 Tax=Capsicum annuum TaxID=4072 RepID=UPI001FB0F67F|nr:uncharacterized protein LOC124887114 [Capsicum annuum]